MVNGVVKKKYKVVCIVQIYNEIEKGNLYRFFKYVSPVVDEIVVYDDCSTDGSFEYAKKITPYVIRGKKNDFAYEVNHKQLLLNYALKLQADFILSLDADEVLVKNAKEKIKTLCDLATKNEIDAYKIKLLNLWRSNNWVRVDSQYDDGYFVRLWKVSPGISFETGKRGLHQRLYPATIKNIETQDLLQIIHYGFADKLNLAYKYLTYRKHGQRGYAMLDRIINEEKILLQELPSGTFPIGLEVKDSKPEPLSFIESLSYVNEMKERIFRPKYSIVCLIYKGVAWLDFVYQQILKYTDMEDVEFYFVANDASKEVIFYLEKNHIPYYEFNNTESQREEWYINNVYRAYNFAAKEAKGDFLIFINSDMCFSPGWLDALKAGYDGQNLVSSRLVESGKLRTGKYGIEKNFGLNLEDYKEIDFLSFAASISDKKVMDGGLFMPLLVRKEHFLSVGGYPEGNLKEGADIFSEEIALQNEKNVAGDAVLMERMKSLGIRHQTAMDSIVYHFQCGEKDDESVKDSEKNIGIAICNDNCDGFMKEKVLWNYLLDNISGSYRLDKNVVGDASFELRAKDYINHNHPQTKIIIQNASFINKIDPEKFTIVFLQDNLRLMGRPSVQQESNLKFANILVTNSVQTTISYPEYDFEIIPIGVDSELFKPQNKQDVRIKYGLSDCDKIGIFVGSFSETKGWPKVIECIHLYKDIKWILVTKHSDDDCCEPNVEVFKRINQNVLSDLLNCADFFIIGSPVETQCLAALEANFCGIPVVMPLVGIYKDFSEDERGLVGVFGDDLIKGVQKALNGSFKPRDILISKGLDIQTTIKKWKKLVEISCFKLRLDEEKPNGNNCTKQSLSKYYSNLILILRTILIKYLIGNYYWKINSLITPFGIKMALRNLLIKAHLLNFVKKLLGRK